MKASRRQQLRTNELAQNLADTIEFVKTNSSTVMVGAAAIVLIIGLVIYWYSASVAAGQRGWADFYGSQLPGSKLEERLRRLQSVATSYKDPRLVASAWLIYGDSVYQLASAPGLAPADRQRSHAEAMKAFQTVVNEYPGQLLAVAGARFKLAGLAEDRRRWDEAKIHYQAIVDDERLNGYPQVAMATEALKRLDSISQEVVFVSPPTSAPSATSKSVAASMPSVGISAPKKAPKTQPATKPAK